MPEFSPKVRKLLAALGVMLAVVVIWDVRYFTSNRRAAPRQARTAIPMALPVPPAPEAPAQADREAISRAVPVSLPAGARNPFLTAGEQFGKSGGRPTETRDKESTPVRLEGIAVSDGVRAALLGGEVVREGEWVGDIKVVRVQQDRVVLARGGRRWTVHLPPPGSPPPEVAP
jgi:hypothetical protein